MKLDNLGLKNLKLDLYNTKLKFEIITYKVTLS